jgi:hypothetical protein
MLRIYRTALLCALLGAAFAPLPARALDCAEYNLESDFWGHKNRPETFELVYGAFSDLRNPRFDAAADTATWDATFNGFRGGERAFDIPLQTQVTIADRLGTGILEDNPDPMRLGTTMDAQAGLVFLEQSTAGYLATTSYCWPMINPNPDDVARALDCLNGRRCPKP